jgi:carboxypeptidase-like protein
MKKSILFFFVFYTSASFSQETFRGKIIDLKTNAPLPYVNIGIVGKNLGAVSNIEGSFSITLPNSYDSDTLKISMVGYTSLSYEVKTFKNNFNNRKSLSIFLEEKTNNLQEVIVEDKKLRTKLLGDVKESTTNTMGFYSPQLGTELGTTIKIKKSPTYLKNFNFFIADNTFDSLFFRLNIYSLENGYPSENILSENIFIKTNITEGKVIINLEKYNIKVQEDFFISLEYIQPLSSDGGKLNFGGSIFHGPSYMRYSSQGKWQKLTSFGTGFNVQVMY